MRETTEPQSLPSPQSSPRGRGSKTGTPSAAKRQVLPLFAFNDIVNNKIPELFPRLKFGFIESYGSWVPYLLHSFKRQFRGEWKYSTSADLFRDYRLYVACETEESLLLLAECIGERR